MNMKTILALAILSAILVPIGPSAEASEVTVDVTLQANRGEAMTLPAEHFRYVPLPCLDSEPGPINGTGPLRRIKGDAECQQSDRDIRS
jgi:hypothetical protein